MGDMSTAARLRQEVADLSPPVVVYICLVALATAATFSALLTRGVSHSGGWAGVIGLAAIATLGERGRIKLRGSLDVSISLLPAVFAAVLFGPLAAMLVFGVSVLVGNQMPIAGRITYFFSRTLTGAAAAGAATAAGTFVSAGTTQVVASSAAAALVAELLDAV